MSGIYEARQDGRELWDVDSIMGQLLGRRCREGDFIAGDPYIH